MSLIIYLLKTILISGILTSYYMVFLRNRPFHGFNRFFLLSIPVISFLLPALALDLPSFWAPDHRNTPIQLLGVGAGKLEEAVNIYAHPSSGYGVSWPSLSLILGISGSFFLSYRLFKSLRYISGLRKNKPQLHLPEAIVYFVREDGTPFFFFRSIFWGTEQDIRSGSGQQILRHEIFHVTENHSLDLLTMEIITLACWFNPFLHIIRRELKVIHEYAADAYAAGLTDKYSYASLLIMNVTASSPSITHPFFKNQIKKRIAMITQSGKNKKALPGRLMILPLIAILACLFSFKMSPIHRSANKSIRVVIDAGHGGIDPGSTGNGMEEKNINLLIAKKIQQLAADYSVEVIMTRDQDKLSGTEQNIPGSLKYRTDLPGIEKADLFISIHTNRSGDQNAEGKNSGFDIYVSGRNKPMYGNSVKLGSLIAENIKQDFTMAAELKQQNSGVMVLDKATVPAILIECGYIDNPADLAYMTEEKHQEKIARDILEGIKKYASLHISYSQAEQQLNADNFSYEDVRKMDLSEIISVHMNSENNTTTLGLKNGSQITVNWTAEMVEKFGALIFPNVISQDSSGIATRVEEEAEYPGGQKGWVNYLTKHLVYPQKAVKKEIQGTVVIQFIVNTDGSLSNPKVISGPEELKSESLRVLKASGKWVPAKNKGMIVQSYHIQPFVYKLAEG